MSNDFDQEQNYTEPEETVTEPETATEAEAAEEPVVTEAAEEPVVTEAAEITEETETAEEVPQPAPKAKKHIGGWIALAVVLVCAAAVCALYFTWLGNLPDDAAEPVAEESLLGETVDIQVKGVGSLSVAPEDVTEEMMTAIVAVNEKRPTRDLLGWVQSLTKGGATEKNSLTNAQLAVHYWNSFYQFSNQYYYFAESLGLDPQHMDETEAEEGWTWQEFFLSSALSAYRMQNAVYQEGLKKGMTLDDELQADYDDMVAELDAMEDINEQLESVYGKGVTLQDYYDVMLTNYCYVSFINQYADSLAPTEEELQAYYDANAETYEDQGIEMNDVAAVSVRHVLIVPEDTESEESWAEAEKRAQELYKKWQAEGATEDGFAELADMESEDPGSNTNGGLYEGVYPGQMVAEFDAWCFEDGRTAGDSGIVRTDYGYHIMYFVSAEETPYWLTQVESDYRNDMAQQYAEELAKDYELSYDVSFIKIVLPGQMQEAE